MGARLGTRQPHRNPDASNLSVPIVIMRDDVSRTVSFRPAADEADTSSAY
jgi:hypothetical protein